MSQLDHLDPAPLIEIEAVTKVYRMGSVEVHALKGVDLRVEEGEFVAVMGASGSGKTTLMNVIGCLDLPTSGQYLLDGVDVRGLNDNQLAAIRNLKIGFVFQSFNLIPTLTALENITLPVAIAGRRPDEEWLATVIDTLGLRDRLHHRPSELSGGQQQRVAVGRALASRPEIVFGDEPTGNLDSHSSNEVMRILRESVDRLGQTVVIVTHDARAAGYADRVLFLADGRIVDELRAPTADSVLDRMKDLEK
jgi:putative ABC transport system ATP-binding protein